MSESLYESMYKTTELNDIITVTSMIGTERVGRTTSSNIIYFSTNHRVHKSVIYRELQNINYS